MTPYELARKLQELDLAVKLDPTGDAARQGRNQFVDDNRDEIATALIEVALAPVAGPPCPECDGGPVDPPCTTCWGSGIDFHHLRSESDDNPIRVSPVAERAVKECLGLGGHLAKIQTAWPLGGPSLELGGADETQTDYLHGLILAIGLNVVRSYYKP